MSPDPASARRAFESVFAAMVSVLERSLRDHKPIRRIRAQALAAMCVGGMVVARTMVDRTLADELHRACTLMAYQLGGWEKRRSKGRKRQ
jgi:TetR/AcrR family transcriptional repressor of nem operon